MQSLQAVFKSWNEAFKTNLVKSCSIGLLLSLGCGVDAGNPDSSSGTTQAFINFSITDAPVDELEQFLIFAEELQFTAGKAYSVDLGLNSEALDLLNYQNGKTLSILEDFMIDPATIDSFTLTLSDREHPVRVVTSNDQATDSLANVAILDANGLLATELEFTGSDLIRSGDSKSFIVDIDLRKTLRELSSDERESLGLDASYIYAIQREHSFFDSQKVGRLIVSDQASNQIFCLLPILIEETEVGDCRQDSAKSTLSDSLGTANFLAIPPDSYNLWLLGDDSTQLIEGSIQIEAGGTYHLP